MIELGIYLGGFLVTYRVLYKILADTDTMDVANGSTEDRVMCAVFTAILCSVWPVVLLFALLYKFATPVSPGEKQAELEEREYWIDQKERELKVGPYRED